MAGRVNLDALIAREDFEVTSALNPAVPTATIQVRDLESNAFFASALRKPDFQRETSEWDPQRVADLVRSFLAGDLIPSIILWRSGAYTFVIDGAHRLSALMAWVQDDYGDGIRSRTFFNDAIPSEQLKAAKATRDLLAKSVGSYAQHQQAALNPAAASGDVLTQARNMAALGIQLQWVTGDAKKAEASFFKINQSAAAIDPTELRLLQTRRKANAIAARAIIRAGTGHKYWSTFVSERQNEIERLAEEIYKALFLPELKSPIKTLDLPAAGKGCSSDTLSLVVDFVNLANGHGDSGQQDDLDGNNTVEHLRACRDVARRLAGMHPGSLALHPAVYFYSDAGRYQSAAFLGLVAFVMGLERDNRFKMFTKHRRLIETTLVANKRFINQLVRKHGSGLRSHGRVAELLKAMLAAAEVGAQSATDVVAEVVKDDRFAFLVVAEKDEPEAGKDFSSEAKSAVFLRDALKSALRCGICDGFIHGGGATIDHVTRKADGGKGNVENGQLAHPFCNSGFKN